MNLPQSKKRKALLSSTLEESTDLFPLLKQSKRSENIEQPPEKVVTLTFRPDQTDIPVDFKVMLETISHLNQSLDQTELTQENRLITIDARLLSANILQKDRFPESIITHPQHVDILYTTEMRKVIDDLSSDEYKMALCLRRPPGVGKSFLLSLYVLLLRQKESNRVLYINNPDICRYNFAAYVANEILYCFWRDRESLDFPRPKSTKSSGQTMPLEQWYNYLTTEINEKECFLEFFHTIYNYFQSQNQGVRVIFVLDQINAITRMRKSLRDHKFAMDFFEIFDVRLCHRIIYSATDNNEDTEFETVKSAKQICKLFNESDSIWFLSIPPKLPSLKVPIINLNEHSQNIVKIQEGWENHEDYDPLKKILEITGRNPYELAQFKKHAFTQGDLSQQLIDQYFQRRVYKFIRKHSNYRYKIPSGEKYLLYQALLSADTRKPCHYIDLYDRNLMYSIKVEETNYFFFICPAASKAVDMCCNNDSEYQTWILGSAGQSFFTETLRYIIHNTTLFNNKIRDRALKRLVLIGLSKRKFDKRPFRMSYTYQAQSKNLITRKVSLNIKPVNKDFQISDIIFFPLNKLLNTITESLSNPKASESFLLVPISWTYDLTDCIILEYNHLASKKEPNLLFYLFQITFNVNEHDKGDIIIANHKTQTCCHEICKVANILSSEFNKNSHIPNFRVKIQFVWITTQTKDDIEFDKIQNQSWIINV